MLTEKEYVKEEGHQCPKCKTFGNIAGGPFDVEDGKAYQEVWCEECGAFWSDVYKLAGYENFTEG